MQQTNSLKSLLRSVPHSEVLFFDPVLGAEKVCQELGIRPPIEIERSAEGTPRVDHIFTVAAQISANAINCYINCDILITPQFGELVCKLHSQLARNYLLVGQRVDIDCSSPVYSASEVDKLKLTGLLHPPHGSDYFVFPKGEFTSANMPELLVGRGSWDNWMIYHALVHEKALVDLSPDYLVAHQNHDYSHRKSVFVGYDSDHEAISNKRFLPTRKKGGNAYHLHRCPWESRDASIVRKPLSYPSNYSLLHKDGRRNSSADAFLTPVVLSVTRNPLRLAKVIECLRKVKPATVYAILDGPREAHPEEAQRCSKALEEVQKIDWPCDLHLDVATESQGYARRVKSGMDLVFSRETQAIVLEDDVEPSLDFFYFCETMLRRFARDESVLSINGHNFGECPVADHPYLTRIASDRGWATWKRAWGGFDLWMDCWIREEVQRAIAERMQTRKQTETYWMNLLQLTYEGKFTSWSLPWLFHILNNNGWTISPPRSLVKFQKPVLGVFQIKCETPLPGIIQADLELLQQSFSQGEAVLRTSYDIHHS